MIAKTAGSACSRCDARSCTLCVSNQPLRAQRVSINWTLNNLLLTVVRQGRLCSTVGERENRHRAECRLRKASESARSDSNTSSQHDSERELFEVTAAQERRGISRKGTIVFEFMTIPEQNYVCITMYGSSTRQGKSRTNTARKKFSEANKPM